MDTISGILLILLLIVFLLINSRPRNKGQAPPPAAPAPKPVSAPQSKPAQAPSKTAPPAPSPRRSIKRVNDFIMAVFVGVVLTFLLQFFSRGSNPDGAIVTQQAGNLASGNFWIASGAIAILVFALLSRKVR